jgi:tRNA pseudouridine65 synthase
MTLPSLYLDDWLVAVHKPSGLLVHRTGLSRHETTFALQQVRDQLGCRVWPVHRLDRATSGLLLFARDADTARILSQQFETRAVEKTYLAIVRGWPDDAGRIDHPLEDVRDEGMPYGDALPGGARQNALTRYQCLARASLPIACDRYPTSRYALLALSPETGRRHQIRRHLKHLSHPIIGDVRYGKGTHNRLFAEHFGVRRLLLAAVGLRVHHPATGLPLSLSCPPAEDFLSVCGHLGWTPEAFPALTNGFCP